MLFLALKLGRPLFLEGEAGVGKTEIAKVLAQALGRRLLRLIGRGRSMEVILGANDLDAETADLPLQQGVLEEAYLFQTLLRNPSARRNMARILANGWQTREGELTVNDLSAALGRGE